MVIDTIYSTMIQIRIIINITAHIIYLFLTTKCHQSAKQQQKKTQKKKNTGNFIIIGKYLGMNFVY